MDISGASLDERRHLDAALVYRLVDDHGRTRLTEAIPVAGHVWVEAEGLRHHLEFKIPDDTPAGEYSLHVVFTDNTAGNEASWSTPLVVLEPEFALVSARFSYDSAGSVPAPAGGVVGQVLYFQLEVLGEDRSRGCADLQFEMEVTDEAGNVVSHLAPIGCRLDDPAFVDDRSKHPLFWGNLSLLREGHFTLRLRAIDHATSASTTFETQLAVAGTGIANAVAGGGD
jgi:hypothetical protein